METNPKTGRVKIPLPKEKDFSHLKQKEFDKEQLQVLNELAKGYTYKQIGDSLGITDKAAGKRTEKLYPALEAHSAISAYRRALKLGLLTLD